MGISGFYKIILLMKNNGIGPRDSRSGAQHRSMDAVHNLLNPDQRGRRLADLRLRLEG
jgi:hypothetical protein